MPDFLQKRLCFLRNRPGDLLGTGRRGGGQEEGFPRLREGKQSPRQRMWGNLSEVGSQQGGIARQRCGGGGLTSVLALLHQQQLVLPSLTLRGFGAWGAGLQPDTDPEVKASASQPLPLKLTPPIPLGAKPQQPQQKQTASSTPSFVSPLSHLK